MGEGVKAKNKKRWTRARNAHARGGAFTGDGRHEDGRLRCARAMSHNGYFATKKTTRDKAAETQGWHSCCKRKDI